MCGGGLIELSSTATAINKKLTLPAALYRFMEPLRRAYCTFLNLVEHHSKESTVHRFEPARPRNRAQHIAANTE